MGREVQESADDRNPSSIMREDFNRVHLGARPRKRLNGGRGGGFTWLMAKTFRLWDVDQGWLLPPSVHEFVPPDHLAHFVRDTVREALDLSAILDTYTEERGFPPYHPGMMVIEALLEQDQNDPDLLDSRGPLRAVVSATAASVLREASGDKLRRGDEVGPYRIVGPLGAGGMGQVYKATDTRLGRTVAVKLIATAPENPELFFREARAASTLNHPGICTLDDLSEHRGEPR